MRVIKYLFASMLLLGIVLCNSYKVDANNSTLHVTTYGGSAYTGSSDYVEVMGAAHSACYIKLTSFEFSGWTPNSMPYDNQGNYYNIYASLYTRYSNTVQASNEGAFNCRYQVKCPTYLSGHGIVGGQYQLKTHSSYSAPYNASFYWTA